MDSSVTHLSPQRSPRLPEGVTFSLPWNHDPGLLLELERRQGRFERMYAAMPPWVAPTGRPWRGGASQAEYRVQMESLGASLGRWGAGLSLLANYPGFPVNLSALVEEARRAAEQVRGVRVVFSDLAVAERAAPLLDGIEIGVSTLAEVKTPVQAMMWHRSCGAKVVTVARSINRNMSALRAIKEVGVELSLVLADLCLVDCPWHSSHTEGVALGPDLTDCRASINYGCHPSAVSIREQAPHLLAIKEPLPGHMIHYAGLAPEMKLPGRSYPTADIIKVFDSYFEAKSLRHPFLPYSEPSEAWDVLAKCDRNCSRCDYCGRAFLRAEPGKIVADAAELEEAARRPKPMEWVFGRQDGARVTIRLVPAGPYRAHRSIGEMSLEYCDCQGSSKPECVTLLEAVADVLERSGYVPGVTDPQGALGSVSWPAGFQIVPGFDDEPGVW